MNFLIRAIQNIENSNQVFKTILIDLDNTIFYSSKTNRIAELKTLEKFGFSYSDFNKAKDSVKSRNLRSSSHNRKLYFKTLLDNSGRSFTELPEMYSYFLGEVLKNDRVSEIMIETLKFFKDKKICAITDYYLLEQIKRLENSGISDLFDFIVTSSEFESEKPSKCLIDKALELTKSKPEECIMIGDSNHDNFSEYEIYSYPFSLDRNIISITGKSGAGKSTLSSELCEIFGGSQIETDGYHKYHRYSDAWKRLTHYNPEANNLVQLGLDVQDIFWKNDVLIPIYNHDTGYFDEPKKFKDSEFVIIDGLHTLYPEVTGDFIKIKIYLDNDNADSRKVLRDSRSRDKTPERVIQSIKERDEDFKKYINIQKDFANILVKTENEICDVQFKNELDFVRNFKCSEKELPVELSKRIKEILYVWR